MDTAKERPWADHPLYRGMTDEAAGPSWRARQKRLAEEEASASPDNWQSPNGAEDYGLSADADCEGEAYLGDPVEGGEADRETTAIDDDGPRASNGHDDEPPPPAGPADYGTQITTTPPSDQPPLALITPCQWKGVDLEEMRWLATHRIPADDVTILSSDGAGGKTTLGLQLAVSVACDLGDWIGTTTSTGPVIFYSAEEPEKEMRRRLDRIARKRGVDPDEIARLHFHFAEPDEALLGISTPSGKIVPTATFHALAKSVTDTKPSLLIVDTIAAVYGGSQNDRFQVRTFINRFRRLARDTGCAVVLLDHPSLSGMNSDTGRSGTVDWRNAVRSFLYMRTIAGDDGVEERTFRELEVVKTNYGPAGEKIRLRWEDGSFVVKGSLSTPQQAAAVAKIDDLFLKLLDKLTAQGRHVRPNPGRSYAPNEFAKEREAEGVTAKAFETSMRRLLDDKKIALKTEGSPSKRTTRIIRPEAPADEPILNAPNTKETDR